MRSRSTDETTNTNRRTSRRLLAAGLVAGLLLAAAVPAAQADDHLDDTSTPLTETICEEAQHLTGPVVKPIRDRELTDAWDYGDAPDSAEDATDPYPTYYQAPGASDGRFPTVSTSSNAEPAGEPGARHRVVSVGWLGNIQSQEVANADIPTLEADADAQPDQDGTTTNLDPATRTPDHDGKDDGLHPATLEAGTLDTIQFRVSTLTGLNGWHVNVLVDWDYDGDWRNSQGVPEWTVRNHPVSVPAGQSQDFKATIDTGANPGTPWVRVTLTADPIHPDGRAWAGSVPDRAVDQLGSDAFPCGETEDYCGPLEVVDEGADSQDEVIECPRDTSGDDETGCSNPEVLHYTRDISTGWNQSSQSLVPHGQADDDWNITRAPFDRNEGAAYSIPAIGPWTNPTPESRWVNPDFHDDGDNDPAPSTPGLYTYEAAFPGDDAAALVLVTGQWSRDDWSSVKPDPDYYDGSDPNLAGFQYREATTNPPWAFGSGWATVAHGYGHTTKDPLFFMDTTPQDTYRFRVDVFNVLTFTGLLVDAELQVYCDLGHLPDDLVDHTGLTPGDGLVAADPVAP